MKRIAIGFWAVALALCMALPAMADFTPYGSMRLLTGWYNVDDEDAAGAVDTTDDVYFELSDISRVGAKFSKGNLSGHVEFGIKGKSGGGGGNDTYDRLLYGTWKFDGGSLMVGQNYPPYTLIAEQTAPRIDLRTTNSRGGSDRNYNAENTLVGYGALWEARVPQIRVKLDNGCYLGLIQPETGTYDLEVANADEDTTLPKIVLGWEFKGEDFMLNPGIAYNTFDVDDDAGFDESVDSWLIYLGGKAALGMADLQWNIHYGQNLGDFGLWNREDAAYATIDPADNDIEDSDCYGGYVQVALPVDPVTITLGVGYTQSENDALGPDEDEQMSYFIQAKYPVMDNFWIVPEVSYYDQMEDAWGNDEPTAWYTGIMWRMDF